MISRSQYVVEFDGASGYDFTYSIWFVNEILDI